MRYAGQNYELPIPLPEGDGRQRRRWMCWPSGSPPRIARMYGFVAEGEPVQLVTFRVEASGVVRKATFVPEPDCGPDASAAVIARRDVLLPEAGGFVSCAGVRSRTRCTPAIASPVRR